jgi:hypothetical protein
VCALSPFPMDDQTALALRHKLRLTVSPVGDSDFAQSPAAKESRFVFPLQVRADKLHWLCAAEDLYRLGHVPKDSLLGAGAELLPRSAREGRPTSSVSRCADAVCKHAR